MVFFNVAEFVSGQFHVTLCEYDIGKTLMFYYTPPHPYHYYLFLNEIYFCNAPSIKPVCFHVRVQIANKISLFQIKLKSNC